MQNKQFNLDALSEEQVKQALKSTGDFKKIFPNTTHFLEATKKFPAYADRLIKAFVEYFKSNDENVSYKDEISLKNIAAVLQIFPAYSNDFITEILKQEPLFSKYTITGKKLAKLTALFPNYKDNIYKNFRKLHPTPKKLLDNNGPFFEGGEQIEYIKVHYPEMADELVNYTLEKFIKQVNFLDLEFNKDVEPFIRSSPRYADTIINLLLQKINIFKTIEGVDELNKILELAPGHREKILQLLFSDVSILDGILHHTETLEPLKWLAPDFPQYAHLFNLKTKIDLLNALFDIETTFKSDSIRTLLYYEKPLSSAIYSNQPSNIIIPDRLFAGLPAFVNSAEENTIQKKTVCIAIYDWDKWTESKKDTFELRMDQLRVAGIEVYIEKNGRRYLSVGRDQHQRDNFYIENEKNYFSTFPQRVRQIIGNEYPPEAVQILTGNNLENILEGDESDYENQTLTSHIKLEKNPISFKNFTHLITEHGKQIQSLSIHQCPNIEKITSKMLPKLSQLTELSLGTKYYLQMKKLFLSFSPLVPHLKKFSIDNFDEDPNFLSKGDFSSLQTLTIKHCNVSNQTLQALFKKAPELKQLELSWCPNLMGTIKKLDLSQLETLTINFCYIKPGCLQSLLACAPNLKKLSILHSRGMNSSDLNHINLPKLEEIHVTGNDLSEASIKTLSGLVNDEQKKELKNNFHIKPFAFKDEDEEKDEEEEEEEENQPEDKYFTHHEYDEYQVDADTALDKDLQQVAEQIFIGKSKSIHPRDIRIHAYDKLKPGTNPAFPFTLYNSHKDLNLQPVPRAQRSAHPLFVKFDKAEEDKENDSYFGRFKLELSTQWQPLPSVSANETLQDFYLSSNDEVEITQSAVNGFHYIRLKNTTDADKTQSVMIETILSCPKSTLTFKDLPEKIKNIAKEFISFREDEKGLDVSTNENANLSPQQLLNKIIEQRAGSCRHRSIAFKASMAKLPQVPVQIIKNKIHMYPEIFHNGMWVRCDLGGYPTNLAINHDLLPEATNNNNSDEDDPENQYTLNFSSRGTERSEEYFKKYTNLTILKLSHINAFPTHLNLSKVKTLEISGSDLNIHLLNEFLKKLPELRTLKISHCTTQDAFANLNLSTQQKLEQVNFIGDFIPTVNALTQVINAARLQTKWVVSTLQLNKDEISQRFDSLIKAKQFDFRIPIARARHIPLPEKSNFLSIVCDSAKSTLLCTSDTHALRVALEKHYHSVHKPCFYVNDPSELQCSNPFIERDLLTNKGTVKKGSGGALYDFIQQYPEGTIIVNYDNFTNTDMVRFNSLLEGSVDGVPISNKTNILGLINPKKPGVYQGADFYSRFEKQKVIDFSINQHSPDFIKQVNENTRELKIELNGGANWQARLLGQWQIKGKDLYFQKGKLATAIEEGYQRIVFNNPPKNDPEFKRFMADMDIHRGIFHQGKLITSLPDHFSLQMTHEVSFADKNQYLHFNQDTKLPDNSFLLNHATIPHFTERYQPHNNDELTLKPGYFEQFSGKTISIYLTETLTSYAWLLLMEQARLHQVKLMLSLAPNVTLPSELAPKLLPQPIQLKLPPNTEIFTSNTPERLQCPPDAVIIDISELLPSDLLSGIDSKFDKEKLTFKFSEKTGFLEKALNKKLEKELGEKNTVILKGKWSNELVKALEPILYQRFFAQMSDVKLILVSENDNTFSFVQPSKSSLPLLAESKPIRINAEFNDRLSCVTEVLKSSPFVFLTGATGVGKTNFVETVWQIKNPACHYGIDKLESWIHDKTPGIKTLFIDEANITSRQWSEMEGLFQQPPVIYLNGQYHVLTQEHKIIFAGNPMTYGGERQASRFFKNHICEVNFNPIPRHVLAARMNLEANCAEPILQLYDYVSQLDKNDTLITPREVIMMARLTKAASALYGQNFSPRIAQYFAYTLAEYFIPTTFKEEFNKKFKPLLTPLPPPLNLPSFVINETNQPAVTALFHLLNLRQLRLTNPADHLEGGLGGIVIEGDPGIGKTVLVMELFTKLNYVEGRDYYKIAPSLNVESKIELLLKAFHEGKMVIIDEINSSPMLERLLNALLEGHDLEGNPARGPGFMLIGTQNPSSQFTGRLHTSLALQHRLQTVCLNPYTKKEESDILRHIGVPYAIRQYMMVEYEQRKKNDSQVCFRDLLKTAKNWVAKRSKQKAVKTTLNALPQVGSICKVTAIANVEKYYAEQLGFKAMPQQAKKSGQPSIRKIAKENGSSQGEILEFSRWQKTLTDIGYDSVTIDFKNNINLLANSIQENLQQGNMPMIAFAVDKDTGHPNPAPSDKDAEEHEHAAVITAFDPDTDKVSLTHWGNHYEVDLVDLFYSAQALKSARSQEFYKLNKAYQANKQGSTPKYIAAQQKIVTPQEGDRISIKPQQDTGFQSKLLIVKKPDVNRLLAIRSTLNFQKAQSVFNQQSQTNRGIKRSLEENNNNNNLPKVQKNQ